MYTDKTISTTGTIPLKFYDDFFYEWDYLPLGVQQRFRSFLDLVTTDPDDPGFLACCGIFNPGSIRKRFYAYHLTEGYVVSWRVKRILPRLRDLVSLKMPKPIRIDILDISRDC